MIDRLNWRIVKFTNLQGGPAYTDLGEVAAIIDTPEPRQEHSDSPLLPVNRGASIYLKSGARFYVKETADAVFLEVHRFRTEDEPIKQPMKLSASAPAGELAPRQEPPPDG